MFLHINLPRLILCYVPTLFFINLFPSITFLFVFRTCSLPYSSIILIVCLFCYFLTYTYLFINLFNIFYLLALSKTFLSTLFHSCIFLYVVIFKILIKYLICVLIYCLFSDSFFTILSLFQVSFVSGVHSPIQLLIFLSFDLDSENVCMFLFFG